MKKRFYGSPWRDGDLADVNEQELAKDGEIKNRESEQVSLPVDVSALVVADQGAQKGEDKQSAEHGVKGQSGSYTKHGGRRKKDSSLTLLCCIMILCLCGAAYVMLSAAKMSQTYSEYEDTVNNIDEDTHVSSASNTMSPKDIHAASSQSCVTVCITRRGDTKRLSGTVVLEGGYIATLFDEVDGADSIKVISDGGAEFSADVVGGNSDTNLALLKTQAQGLKSITAATVSPCVGQKLYAVGALGMEGLDACLVSTEVSYDSRAVCVINDSGQERRLRTVQLSPMGDSSLGGCPVFDDNGQAVGIVILTQDNADFVIEIGVALPVLEAIRRGEELTSDVLDDAVCFTPCLGVVCEDYDEKNVRGARITAFEKNNKDSEKILRVGDVIVAIEDSAIRNSAILEEVVSRLNRVGAVEVFVLREGQILSFFVSLYYK